MIQIIYYENSTIGKARNQMVDYKTVGSSMKKRTLDSIGSISSFFEIP